MRSDTRRGHGRTSKYNVLAKQIGSPPGDPPERIAVSKSFYHSVRIGEPYDLLLPSRPGDPHLFVADTERYTPGTEVLVMGWVVASLGIGIILLGTVAEVRQRAG